jgi:hypothetical protein
MTTVLRIQTVRDERGLRPWRHASGHAAVSFIRKPN